MAQMRKDSLDGIMALPNELLLEILTHYPIPLATGEDNLKGAINAEAHLSRHTTVLALSETCSPLRRLFRPFVWERIEVFSGMLTKQGTLAPQKGKEGDEQFALELLRQLETVTIRDPTLAECVKYVLKSFRETNME